MKCSSELPTAKDVGFLLPRPDSIPTAEASADETVSAKPCGRRVTEVLISTGVTSACPMPSKNNSGKGRA
ncbi:MAG: hypothetical protein H5T34_05580 [Candidatus Methanomethyliales bacterium]|nr:hypothetical protein [Candidatus Methanomethylicales archaeon]